MSTRTFWILILLIALGDLIFAASTYGRMPERVPIHWNIEGKADGWGSRSTYLFLGPGLVGFGVLLALLLPVISPPKFKIDPFRETFNLLMFDVILLMVYINVITATNALNPRLDLSRWLVAGIFGFFGFIGNLLGRIKPNFYAGIRTPWTLANDEVWRRTHRFGGKLFFYGGIAGAVMAAFGWLMPAVGLILVIAFVPIIYSFVISKRLESQPPQGAS